MRCLHGLDVHCNNWTLTFGFSNTVERTLIYQCSKRCNSLLSFSSNSGWVFFVCVFFFFFLSPLSCGVPHSPSETGLEVSWSDVAQEANADVLPSRLDRGRVDVRVVCHCNRGHSCMSLQPMSALFVNATDVRVYVTEPLSELFVTATDVRIVRHCKQMSELYVTATQEGEKWVWVSATLSFLYPSVRLQLATGLGGGGGGEVIGAEVFAGSIHNKLRWKCTQCVGSIHNCNQSKGVSSVKQWL